MLMFHADVLNSETTLFTIQPIVMLSMFRTRKVSAMCMFGFQVTMTLVELIVQIQNQMQFDNLRSSYSIELHMDKIEEHR